MRVILGAFFLAAEVISLGLPNPVLLAEKKPQQFPMDTLQEADARSLRSVDTACGDFGWMIRKPMTSSADWGRLQRGRATRRQ